MNASEVLSNLKLLEEEIENYETGDLMQLSDIKNSYMHLADIIKEFKSLKDVSKLLYLVSDFVGLLFTADDENDVLNILRDVNVQIKGLFNKSIPPKEVASKLNSIIKVVQTMRKEAREEADKIEQEKKEPRTYPDDYFDNLIDDQNMLLQLNEEVKEHLDNAQYTLLELETDPKDADNINKVFRSFHTIKGSSAFLGLKNFEEVGHRMEDILMLVRESKLSIDKSLIDIIFYGIDLLRIMSGIMDETEYNISSMKSEFMKVNIFEYIDFLTTFLEYYEKRSSSDILSEYGQFIKKDKKPEAEGGSSESTEELTLDTEEAAEETLNKNVPEESESDSDKKEETEEKKKEEKAEKRKETPIQTARKAASTRKINFVKVSYDRLNTLIDIVGELVINQSMLKQVIMEQESVEDSERTISQLESITTNIKNLVLAMGMVPIGEIFNKLRVVIRNTADDLGKKVKVNISGEDTELDRNVMEAIYDPLVHMVRNSVDHGLEGPDERTKAGKDAAGNIYISAQHKGNGIEISVYDDGRGIVKDKIIRKAVKNEILTEDEAFNLSDKEIYGLLFAPGFSTAQKVTEVSGRGVGLDVVKKNIEDIRGKIEITSEEGQFTRFVIRLPLTLAIIEGFVTQIGANKYVFPFNIVEEIIVPEEANINRMDDGNMMLFNRGNYVPIIFASTIFKEEKSEKDITRMLVIIISFEGKNYGIVVDDVIGKQEIVIKNLSEVLSNLSLFSGGTIFGDGTIGFVIDVEGFLDNAKDYL